MHRHAVENLNRADALLFGRVTYEMMEAAFRPAWTGEMPDWMEPFRRTIDAAKKYVVSSTLERADWNNSTIIAGDVIERVRALRADQNVLVWGSPTLVRALMEHDLVDEYVLLVSPIVRAEGIRLFSEGGEQHGLRITEATVLGGGMLALRMAPGGASAAA